MKTKIKRIISKIKNSKTFLAIIMLAIGISYTVIYYEGGKLLNDYKQVIIYIDDGAVAKAHAQVAPLAEVEGNPSPHAVESVEDKIKRIAKKENFKDAELLTRIAKCESGLNPDKDSDFTNSSATGLYQFTQGTWKDGCRYLNKDWKLTDRNNIEKSTQMAIYFIQRGELSRWDASQACWSK